MSSQQMKALNKANEIRFARAELKRAIREGRASLPAVILNPPPEIANMRIKPLLTAVRGVGEIKTYRWMRQLGMTDAKKVCEATERQRTMLVDLLGGR